MSSSFNCLSFEKSSVLCAQVHSAVPIGTVKLNIQTFNLMLQIESPPSCSFWMSRHVGRQLTKCCVCSLVFSVIKYDNNNKTAGRALDYRQAVNSFVRLDDTDLWPNLLSNAEWHAIELVTTWLKSFRSATIQISATQTPMLSTTHAIFRGLQEELRDTLRSLPDSTSPCLIKGLTDAHRKLSDYYHTFDVSPFYSWSARKFILFSLQYNY